MHAQASIDQTLRVLMARPCLLRTNISVFHGESRQVSNLALEISPGRGDTLSAVELCPDGELLSGGALDDGRGPLDTRAVTQAMRGLWPAGADEPPLDAVQSVRATSLLMASESAFPFEVLQSWHFRRREGAGVIDVWHGDEPVRTLACEPPADCSLRELVLHLQEAANQRGA
ncbi:hypothetical protein [Chitinimonas koreensis]|uniref:hypothetical protein n=1 Tax=Chitinimonas koreensis TaxID=356302 RepID=UPI000401A69F|nr:hypothetical protein [Chitinimonas koreensis]QNM97055.1 hypothetical protein H9L41_01585 [Chitinimonas koreensis]